MKCRICDLRKARRHCPGLNAEICSPCCGREREETINCPFDCVYLREARVHEKLPELDESEIPGHDLSLTEEFVDGHRELILMLGLSVFEAALKFDAIDNDAREALDALAQTLRTLQSGLYYESRPANPIAARIADFLQQRIDVIRKEATEKGISLRDAEILAVVVFWQRMERRHNNGRKRGRAFIDFLRQDLGPLVKQERESPLIVA
jgi:hypothetical protein